MVGQGRESKESNDLFFVCSLIDYIARQSKNRRRTVVEQLGKDRIQKLLDLADVYHSDNIDRVADDFISEAGITQGDFDNVASCRYAVPSHWDIGKVYRRLIEAVTEEKDIATADALMEVYGSFVSDQIDNYNSSFYYENPSYIFESYENGAPL